MTRYYKSELLPLARQLRKNMTPWERKLWYLFLKTYRPAFRRQTAIGSYIADFCCLRARLVVELDGGGHFEQAQAEKDKVRTKFLEAQGFQVLRICNSDIDRNFSGACEAIDAAVRRRLKTFGASLGSTVGGAVSEADSACRKTIFDTPADCKKVRKTSNSRPSAYIGTVGRELRSKSKSLRSKHFFTI